MNTEIHRWIGLKKDILKAAAKLGHKNPVAANDPTDIDGIYDHLIIHLCGNVQAIPNWNAIKQAIAQLELLGAVRITRVRHL